MCVCVCAHTYICTHTYSTATKVFDDPSNVCGVIPTLEWPEYIFPRARRTMEHEDLVAFLYLFVRHHPPLHVGPQGLKRKCFPRKFTTGPRTLRSECRSRLSHHHRLNIPFPAVVPVAQLRRQGQVPRVREFVLPPQVRNPRKIWGPTRLPRRVVCGCMERAELMHRAIEVPMLCCAQPVPWAPLLTVGIHSGARTLVDPSVGCLLVNALLAACYRLPQSHPGHRSFVQEHVWQVAWLLGGVVWIEG